MVADQSDRPIPAERAAGGRPAPTGGDGSPKIDDAALFRAATAIEALSEAWSRVLSNGGAAGGDGVPLARFLVNAPARIARLSAGLRDGSYAPGPLRRVDIPKKSGGTRPLAIPCVVDRIAQTAVMQALAPRLDEEFAESSFGYRLGRGVRDAVKRVAALRGKGHVYVVDADIAKFFESVPHDKLLERLAQSMTDGPLMRLIGLWIEHGGARGRGLPQGSPLSPLLANLYLDRLDDAFAKRGAHIVRFADDFVILAESRHGAEGALVRAEKLLAEHGLSLNREKTRVTSFDQGFRFLGHLFVRSMVLAAAPDDDFSELQQAMRALAADDARAAAETAEERVAFDHARRAGYDPGHRVLHVVSADRRLSLRNRAFAVEAGSGGPGAPPVWREILAIPHAAVDRIDLGPQAEVDPDALRHALATETLIAFVDGHGETAGWLGPALSPRAGRHLAQTRHAGDPALRLALAKRFVEGRVRNQRALLRRLNRDRHDPTVLKALADINALLRRLPQADTLAALMGHEGRATALYWPALSRLFAHGFRLGPAGEPPRRVREIVRDPVNILLNVAAALLARDVAVAAVRAGLHPGFGLLHATDDHRDACVFDLMEEFRAPLAESPVVQAINGRAIGDAAFEPRPDGGVRLKSEGFAAMVRAYERAVAREVKSLRDGRRRTWRGIMLDQALGLAAHVEGRETYAPYVIDY
ncbi:CRISPR-associated protein Cas1 [Rhodovulum sp. PH10]|uniref:CRISPR-associated endonuclease Cas1 n=1 Tax=Rhodovulum sp. PH10 TaxID=1187851 RepID=UPI00027C2126|nr:CRISPR-associated endonuclease Cas1 [Rhodovulum sp. PH10]EJW09347.1 CRISPR-associated protein Cas1 [Rhodovulum sp. PH10]